MRPARHPLVCGLALAAALLGERARPPPPTPHPRPRALPASGPSPRKPGTRTSGSCSGRRDRRARGRPPRAVPGPPARGDLADQFGVAIPVVVGERRPGPHRDPVGEARARWWPRPRNAAGSRCPTRAEGYCPGGRSDRAPCVAGRDYRGALYGVSSLVQLVERWGQQSLAAAARADSRLALPPRPLGPPLPAGPRPARLRAPLHARLPAAPQVQRHRARGRRRDALRLASRDQRGLAAHRRRVVRPRRDHGQARRGHPPRYRQPLRGLAPRRGRRRRLHREGRRADASRPGPRTTASRSSPRSSRSATPTTSPRPAATLAEDPDMRWPDSYCPSNPESYRILFDLMDEVLEVLRPRRVHIGHDEWRAGAFCARCRGKDTGELFAEDVLKIHAAPGGQGHRDLALGRSLRRLATTASASAGPRAASCATSAPTRARPATGSRRPARKLHILNWSGEEGDADLQEAGLAVHPRQLRGQRARRTGRARIDARRRRSAARSAPGAPSRSSSSASSRSPRPLTAPTCSGRRTTRSRDAALDQVGALHARGARPARLAAPALGHAPTPCASRCWTSPRPSTTRPRATDWDLSRPRPGPRLRPRPPLRDRRSGSRARRRRRGRAASGRSADARGPARGRAAGPRSSSCRPRRPRAGRAIHAGDQTHFPRESSELLGFYEIRYADELVATHEIRFDETVARWDAGLAKLLYLARPVRPGKPPRRPRRGALGERVDEPAARRPDRLGDARGLARPVRRAARALRRHGRREAPRRGLSLARTIHEGHPASFVNSPSWQTARAIRAKARTRFDASPDPAPGRSQEGSAGRRTAPERIIRSEAHAASRMIRSIRGSRSARAAPLPWRRRTCRSPSGTAHGTSRGGTPRTRGPCACPRRGWS